MGRILRQAIYFLIAIIAIWQPAAANQWQFTGVDRIVAISDIHGAYGAMVETLQSANVIDDSLSWSGGTTHLVIVGDILDRGPQSRAAMDLLIRLEGEAAAASGKVHVLIGNHEAMNIVGDLRYVAVAEYAAFADDETEAERERWFDLHLSQRAPEGADADTVRQSFEESFPPGYFAHRRAFSADGQYGSWLLTKPVIVVINETAFVHGGLSPSIAEYGLQGVNQDLVGELRTYAQQVQHLIDAGLLLPTDSSASFADLLADTMAEGAAADVLRLRNSYLHDPNGPLWYRGTVVCSELVEADRRQGVMRVIGAQRLVVGHTPTSNRRIMQRLDGRIIEIDTGMLHEYYNGNGNALVIEGERLFTISQGSAEEMPLAKHPRQVGARTAKNPLLSEDIEELLRSGEISERRENDLGHTIVTVRNGEQSVDARFVRRKSRNIYPEVSAYRLDRLLHLDAVPVTVKREVDGDDGSLQFLPVNWISERQRESELSGGGAFCPLEAQWDAMNIFDVLVGNNARWSQTVRYDLGNWQLMLVGHEQSFTTTGRLPAKATKTPLKIGAGWTAALNAMTDDVLQEQFADVLSKRRINALAERRDRILSQ